MLKDHNFTVEVEPDLLRAGRSRWTLHEFGQVRDRSEVSFATKREAAAGAAKALGKRNVSWPATL